MVELHEEYHQDFPILCGYLYSIIITFRASGCAKYVVIPLYVGKITSAISPAMWLRGR